MIANLGRNKDALGGVLMLLIGALAAWQGTAYSMGTLSRIGPGFFPVALGILLALVGAWIVASSGSSPSLEARTLEWRAWFLIAAGIVAFIVLGTYGGLVPASFAIVFLSALGDRGNTPRSAALLALVMTVAVTVIFYYGLHMQFPLFTWG